ncbi:hypothetical protein AYI70_g4275 [Smittium culicis]|uniref:Uncharacterized protein n=1 Tax=Smittium culicis TaxID=133412 RepID=A0A1R1XZS2_9FUNG|nr:hypothetical protein AYI70_g4275 [Smittium culicis]
MWSIMRFNVALLYLEPAELLTFACWSPAPSLADVRFAAGKVVIKFIFTFFDASDIIGHAFYSVLTSDMSFWHFLILFGAHKPQK